MINDLFLDSIPVCDHDTGRYCGQSHKSCYCVALKEMEFIGPKRERKERDKIDQWIAKNQETCLFCAEPLDRRFNRCECVDGIKKSNTEKTEQHEAWGYDAHHLMQVMSQLQERGEIYRQQHGKIHHFFSRRSALH